MGGKLFSWMIVLASVVAFAFGYDRLVCQALLVISMPLFITSIRYRNRSLLATAMLCFFVGILMSGWVTETGTPEAPLLTSDEVFGSLAVSYALLVVAYLVLHTRAYRLFYDFFAEAEEDDCSHRANYGSCSERENLGHGDRLNEVTPDLDKVREQTPVYPA